MEHYNHSLLREAVAAMGLPALTKGQEDLFEAFAARLCEVGSQMNLTAILDPDGIALLHFADSLMLLSCFDLPRGARICDVGSGAGFPMIPVLICRPDLCVTLMDSTAKKVHFLNETLRLLKLPGQAIAMRAEEAGSAAEYREQFDCVTARAVSRLNKLNELCLPLVRTGGDFFALKGPGGSEELAEAQKGLSLLGGSVIAVSEKTLINGEKRTLIDTKKERETPAKYPREYKQITAKPL